MAKTFSELQALALQIRDEILEKKNTAPRVGAALLDMIDNTIQNITYINQKLSVFEHVCSGFKRVTSESQLPVTPPEDENNIGYLVGNNLYIYVGTDGNSVNGRYFNVGPIVGPQGEIGPQGIVGPQGIKGEKGEQGNSGVSGTTDNIEVVNNLDGGESTPERIKVLAAEQGRVLNNKFYELKWSKTDTQKTNSDHLFDCIDEKGNLLFYIDKNGYLISQNHSPKETRVLSENLFDFIDENGNILFSIDSEGYLNSRNQSPKTVSSKSDHLFDCIDEKGNLLFYIDKNGRFVANLDDNVQGLKRDIPENATILNAYKKAKQLETINWTPKAFVPNNLTGFEAEQTVIGLPYSSVKEVDTYIPYDVSLHTFMTAVNNKYSLLYTENISDGNTGIQDYHGTNAHTYMGCVCNIFALWPLGCNIPYNSYEIERHPELFEKLYDQSHGSLKLMDLIWEPGHCNIITDIYRDGRGNVKKIYWSEATQYTPTTHEYTPEEFNARLKQYGGIIYRFKDLYKNINYDSSEYVAVEDEIKQSVTYNNDVCTFKGDRACFREGDIIRINYNKGVYNQIEIYQNESLVQTLEITHEYEIDLTSLDLGYGLYKARLKNGESYSEFTYFEIVETNVSCEKQQDNYKISFSSSNGIPIYLEFCYLNGYTFDCIPITDSDRDNGYKVCSFEHEATQTVYVKVHFQAEYGRARNELVNTNIY